MQTQSEKQRTQLKYAIQQCKFFIAIMSCTTHEVFSMVRDFFGFCVPSWFISYTSPWANKRSSQPIKQTLSGIFGDPTIKCSVRRTFILLNPSQIGSIASPTGCRLSPNQFLFHGRMFFLFTSFPRFSVAKASFAFEIQMSVTKQPW